MASTVLPNGIIVPEKFSRGWYADLYHNWQELDNLLGGGTPKDGTLTIQKNGDTVGTFSANQATDETIDIEVPTKTSDLTNDSGFITGVSWDDVSDKPSFATVATSGSYNDLSNKPTIPTVNDATLTIQKNGTTINTFTANSSTDKTVNIQCVDLNSNQTVGGNKEFTGTTTAHDVIPSATDTYSLGSSTNKWKSFNGVEPSELSLPSDTYITIDTTSFAWGVKFTFTPSVNGHLFINISSSTGIRKLSLKTGRGEYYFSNQTDILRFTMPVYKGKLVAILANSSAAETVIPGLTLFPLQGNV